MADRSRTFVQLRLQGVNFGLEFIYSFGALRKVRKQPPDDDKASEGAPHFETEDLASALGLRNNEKMTRAAARAKKNHTRIRVCGAWLLLGRHISHVWKPSPMKSRARISPTI